MVLSIILILVLALVAYAHYLQGFFASVISAVLATASVLVAFSYFEPVVAMIQPKSAADSAPSMVLVALFAVTYLILRIIVDLIVSGYVQLPPTLDKVGAAIFGITVGAIVAGVLAVAAQGLSFGPEVAGYARYRIQSDQQVAVQIRANQSADRHIYDELADETIGLKSDGTAEPHESLLVPFDDWIIGFVSFASSSGPNAQPFKRIHPDYLQELFGQRIGIELGAKRTAPPVAGKDAVNVLGVYTVAALPEADTEFANIVHHETPLPKVLSSTPNRTLLIVRVQFRTDASDDDHLVRLGLGSVRLCVPTADGGYINLYPVGTVDAGVQLMVSKSDDPMFIPAEKAADFCFVVDAKQLHELGEFPDLSALPAKIPAESEIFVEAKRYGRVALAGLQVEKLKGSDQVEVMRKKVVTDKIASSDPDALKKQLIGAWTTTGPNNSPATLTYSADGTWKEDVTVNNQPMSANGTWSVVSAGADGLVISRNSGNAKVSCKIVFSSENQATQTEGSKPARSLSRK